MDVDMTIPDKEVLGPMTRIGMDSKVASLAHDLRDHYGASGAKTLSVPDAIHLATAILYRVDEFHSFDEEGSSSKSLF